MAVIGIVNPKGGVGKSLTTSNIGVAMHKLGKDVLLADADPRQKTLRNWKDFSGERDYPPVIVFDKPTLHVDIPKLRPKFEHILIDGGSKNDNMLSSILRCADIVVIPVQPSGADILGSEPLIELVKERQEIDDNGKPFPIFLINSEVKNSKLAKDIGPALEQMNIPILSSRISRSLQYIESQGDGTTVFERTNKHALKLSEEIIIVTRKILEFIDEKIKLS